MEHSEQVRLLKQLMHQLDTDTNLDAGVMLRNPASTYTCPERAAKERELFFRGHPQMVGMSGDLPNKGSFLTRDDVGMSILATRDKNGKFRAFLNACRHRGAQIESEERGDRKRFMCPFHAWTYSSEGELVNIPKPGHFGEVDKSCHGLIELPAVEQHGILVVHPDPNGVIDTDVLFEGVGPDFDSWNMESYAYVGSDRYEVDLNWKLAIDTFGETYHFNTLHKNTLAPVFYGNAQCFDSWERNHRMILCVRDIDGLRARPEEEWNVREGGFPVYYLFPNVILNVGRHSVIAVRVYPHPEIVGRSVSEVSFYYDPVELENPTREGSPEEFSKIFSEIIRDEDYVAAAMAQRSADSGVQDSFLFGRNEPTLHHYHNTYLEVLGEPPLEEVKPGA
jgi:phenylpropionate dioxygenase-like ring-hydroxylating dioxygenase large terminal subunit